MQNLLFSCLSFAITSRFRDFCSAYRTVVRSRAVNTVQVAVIIFSMSACDTSPEDDDTLVGEWYKKSSYEGVARSGAVGFVIEGKAYVGTGYDGTNWLTDFYQYDAEKNNWYKKANFPGAGRSAAVSFTVNGKGYDHRL